MNEEIMDQVIDFLRNPGNALIRGGKYSTSEINNKIDKGIGGKFNEQITDYLIYNSIDKSCFDRLIPFFVRIKRGLFEYVGEHYAFSGELICYPKNIPNRVGDWKDGALTWVPGARERVSKL